MFTDSSQEGHEKNDEDKDPKEAAYRRGATLGEEIENNVKQFGSPTQKAAENIDEEQDKDENDYAHLVLAEQLCPVVVRLFSVVAEIHCVALLQILDELIG